MSRIRDKIRHIIYLVKSAKKTEEQKRDAAANKAREAALDKLRVSPRYAHCTTDIFGPKFELPDGPTFPPMYEEIFEKEIYKFKPKTDNPLIIDGGANVGLSVLYFKKLYPDCKIIAFEPDTNISGILEKNIKTFDLKNVELQKKALWSSETTLEFEAEGSDSGRLLNSESKAETRLVPTARLRDYLDQPVDFLKLDIEGAEGEVLLDCKDVLKSVQNIFVEYHSFAGQDQDISSVIEILSDSGFRLYLHPSGISSPSPFYSRNTYNGMDMQINIFGLRE